MKWIWTYPAVCVPGTTIWELLLGGVLKVLQGLRRMDVHWNVRDSIWGIWEN
jgi:hypothetical protein